MHRGYNRFSKVTGGDKVAVPVGEDMVAGDSTDIPLHPQQNQGTHQHLLCRAQNLQETWRATEKEQHKDECGHGVVIDKTVPTIIVKLVESILAKILFFSDR